MIVVGRHIIERFVRKHADSKPALSSWLEEAGEADWKSPRDVRDRYRLAAFLSGNRVVFAVGGNSYRLVGLLRYQNGILLVERVGTHAEHARWSLA